MDEYYVLKVKTIIFDIHRDRVCEDCRRKIKLLLLRLNGVYTVFIDAHRSRIEITGTLDTDYLTKNLERITECSQMIEPLKSSHSVKSAAQSKRSQSNNIKAGGSGGESQSQKGSKALSAASMENKSVKKLDLTDLESKRSGKNCRNGGLFGFGKFFGFGKNGGEKRPKPCSKKSPMRNHNKKKGSKADDTPLVQDREPLCENKLLYRIRPKYPFHSQPLVSC